MCASGKQICDTVVIYSVHAVNQILVRSNDDVDNDNQNRVEATVLECHDILRHLC